MKLTTIVVATAFALSSAAALAQPLAQPGPYWRGTTNAPSVGSYTWPSVGTTNAVPTWKNTNPRSASSPRKINCHTLRTIPSRCDHQSRYRGRNDPLQHAGVNSDRTANL